MKASWAEIKPVKNYTSNILHNEVETLKVVSLFSSLPVIGPQQQTSVKSFESESLKKHSIPASNRFGSDETALWHAFKEGDREAFDNLYRTHISVLISYGYKLTNNRSLIQDCIQDLFVELWNNRSNQTSVLSIRHYLLKSLRYKLVRTLRQDVNESLEESQIPANLFNIESDMLQREASKQQAQQLDLVLNQLPKRQKEAIYLRYYEELSNEEVAHVMGVNYQSACKFIYTALKTLREKLKLSALFPFVIPFLDIIKKFF
jgi:RNA polymerase sigma factor (sigma-70 family)